MVKETFTMAPDRELDMKNVAMLIQKASTFQSSLWLYCDGRRANVKSLLGLMSLNIAPGCEIEVTAEGSDEEKAAKAIREYMLGEEH